MTLTDHRDHRLSLSALSALCEAALRDADLRVEDGRVGPIDERTLRYYQTLGLLDRPLAYEGRQAIYGYRHLLQALSVRLLQARGHSLAQIQEALAGVDTLSLETALLSAMPGTGGAVSQADLVVPPPIPAHRPLLAAEVASGVTVLLDPRHAADSELIFASIAALFPFGGSR